MRDYSEQAYFVDIPSIFISEDGKQAQPAYYVYVVQ